MNKIIDILIEQRNAVDAEIAAHQKQHDSRRNDAEPWKQAEYIAAQSCFYQAITALEAAVFQLSTLQNTLY